jgi:hypothetical protein
MQKPSINDVDLKSISDEDLMFYFTKEKVREKSVKGNLESLLGEMRRRGGLRTSEGFFTETYRSTNRMVQSELVDLCRRLGATDTDIESCKKPAREAAGWRYAK